MVNSEGKSGAKSSICSINLLNYYRGSAISRWSYWVGNIQAKIHSRKNSPMDKGVMCVL